jgi:hypothetical protein
VVATGLETCLLSIPKLLTKAFPLNTNKRRLRKGGVGQIWCPRHTMLKAHQHRSSNFTKFTDGPDKTIAHENSHPVRCDLELYLSCDIGKLGSRVRLVKMPTAAWCAQELSPNRPVF